MPGFVSWSCDNGWKNDHQATAIATALPRVLADDAHREEPKNPNPGRACTTKIERASHLPYLADDLSSVNRTARPGRVICPVKQLEKLTRWRPDRQ